MIAFGLAAMPIGLRGLSVILLIAYSCEHDTPLNSLMLPSGGSRTNSLCYPCASDKHK